MSEPSEPVNYQPQKRPFDRLTWWIWSIVGIVFALVAIYLFSQRALVSEKSISVLVHDVPAYHLITDMDLTNIMMTEVADDVIAEPALLIGRYTKIAVSAEKPITMAQLVPIVDEKYVLDTTAVSIPATAAMTYNGQLTSGTIVTVWTVADNKQAQELLEEVLVLDMQKVEGQGAEENDPYPYVIVLAVPEGERGALLTAIINNSISLTISR